MVTEFDFFKIHVKYWENSLIGPGIFRSIASANIEKERKVGTNVEGLSTCSGYKRIEKKPRFSTIYTRTNYVAQDPDK